MLIVILAQIAAVFFNLPFKGIGIVISCLLAIIAMEIRCIRKQSRQYTFMESVAAIILSVAAAMAFIYFLTQSVNFSG